MPGENSGDEPEELVKTREKEVVTSGNAGQISVPKSWVGQRALAILIEGETGSGIEQNGGLTQNAAEHVICASEPDDWEMAGDKDRRLFHPDFPQLEIEVTEKIGKVKPYWEPDEWGELSYEIPDREVVPNYRCQVSLDNTVIDKLRFVRRPTQGTSLYFAEPAAEGHEDDGTWEYFKTQAGVTAVVAGQHMFAEDYFQKVDIKSPFQGHDTD